MFSEIYKKYLKQINICFFIFAILFSLTITVSRHVFNLETDTSTIDTVYVTDFHFVDLIVWIGMVPVIYILLTVIHFFCTAGKDVFWGNGRTSRRGIWVLVFSFVLIMLLWFPYFPSYWPGGIYSDTVDSINMALYKKPLDNHNPILYTLIWRAMFFVTGAFSGEGDYGGLKLFTVVQALLLAGVLSYFIYRCYKWGVHKAFLVLCLLCFGLFPLYPYYGISMWKDTLFSLTVFFFSIFLYSVFSRKSFSVKESASGDFSVEDFAEKTQDISRGQLALYCVLSILIVFLRNNGIHTAAFYSVTITVIMLCLKRKKIAVKLGIASLAVLIISGIIQGPVFNRCGYNINSTTESMGIPLQQVAYIVSTEGRVTEEDLEVIDRLLPVERWRELYNPIVVDSIKFSPEFNHDYLEDNGGEFLKMYLRLALKNPVKAVKAYMISTMGFWDVTKSSSTAYICDRHFGNVEYFMSDYFDYYLDFSFRNLAEPKHYISAAIFAWMMLGTVFICLAKRNYQGLICVMPTFGVWLTIMIAVPVAFSFRYVYALFLCAPLYLMVCVDSG